MSAAVSTTTEEGASLISCSNLEAAVTTCICIRSSSGMASRLWTSSAVARSADAAGPASAACEAHKKASEINRVDSLVMWQTGVVHQLGAGLRRDSIMHQGLTLGNNLT